MNSMIVFLSMYVLSILGFVVHLFTLDRSEWTRHRILELLLLYQIIFSLGMTSLLAFIGLTFMADYIATYTGWPACPFQQELGNVNLAFGILGMLSIWYRGNFWLATIWGFSIWILADGIHHIVEMIVHKNYEPGNIGINLVTDLVVPLILLILLYLYRKSVPPLSQCHQLKK
jgi:hypothetical protein